MVWKEQKDYMVKPKFKIELVYWLIGLFLAFFVLKNLFSFFNDYKFALAQKGELTQIVEMEGAILHNENVINSNFSGRVAFEFNNNERVSVGSRVASVYIGDFDENLHYELADIKLQLSELEKSTEKKAYYSLDLGQKKTQIINSVKNIINYSINNEYERILAEKRSVHNMIDTSTIEEKKAKIENLKARKSQIENEIGSYKKDIVSANSGVLITYIDGNENILSFKERNKILPSILKFEKNNIAKTYAVIEKGEPLCKVVDNYTWYYLGIVDEKLAKQIRVGENVVLSFSAISGRSINATVENIGEPENGKNVVVFLCNQEIEESYLVRATSCTMEFKNYRGIKLPKPAIRILDGQTGVYIVKEEKAVFKKVDVLYSNENFAIIDEENGELKLFDEVIINGKNLRQGKPVRK